MAIKTEVLVFRTGHLGDTVCAIPAFRLIRNQFANSDISLLTDKPDTENKVASFEVARKLNVFDRVLTYRSGRGWATVWALIKAVRAVRPNIVIILPQVYERLESVRRKRRLFLLCGVPDVRGIQLSSSSHAWHANEPNRLIQILSEMGITGTKPSYDIPTDEGSNASLFKKLRSAGINSRRPLVVFCGGGKAKTQCWPLKRYAAVLQRLWAETGWEIAGVGTSEELDNYRAQVLPIFTNLKLLDPLTLPEMFEFHRRAAVYFGNDTGPMHVAAAVGCPTAVVMSARNAPGMWDPDVEPRLIIRNRIECEGCFLTDCFVKQHRCMLEISVEQVMSQVIPFIGSLRPHRREGELCAGSVG